MAIDENFRDPVNSDFSGKRVLISGAAGGFGVAMARAFAAGGARLILSDLDEVALAPIVKELSAVSLTGDVADPDHHLALVALAQQAYGGLDIAVNNAGIVNSMAQIPDIDVKTAKSVIDIDLMGVFYALQAQLPQMAAGFVADGQPRAVVNIASVAGLIGCPMLSIYSAAKHGVVGLTKAAAAEYARRGIRVNAICPSFAATEMVEKYFNESGKSRASAENALVRGIPMGRIAEVHEVVQAILFAADPKNSFMTGETLAVDGGLSSV